MAAASRLLAAGVWSAARPAPARSPNARLRIAAIGVGNRGEINVLAAANEEIVALCDVDQRYLEERRERFPDARAYADFRELLERESDLDAVIVSTPDHTHFPACLQALQRRLHVYCETPLVHRHADLKPLIEAAERAQAVTQTGNQYRASKSDRQAVAWLKAGVVGQLREVHTWTDRPFWPQGGVRPAAAEPPKHLAWDLWLGPALERPYAPEYHPLNWRGFWDFGGGALADRVPHLLDPLVAAFDLPPPQRIRAESSGATRDMAPNWSILRFDFPRTAATPGDSPTWQLVWYDGGKQPPQSLTGVSRLPGSGSLVIGSEARLFIPALGAAPRLLVGPDRKSPPPPPLDPPETPSHMDQWLAACRDRTAAASNFAYGARVAELCILGNVALRMNEPLRWDVAKNAPPELLAPPIRPWLSAAPR